MGTVAGKVKKSEVFAYSLAGAGQNIFVALWGSRIWRWVCALMRSDEKSAASLWRFLLLIKRRVYDGID